MPHDGFDGFALTLALCAAYPAGLWAARFLSDEERERLGALFARVRSAPAREVDEREAEGRVGGRPGRAGPGPRRDLGRAVAVVAALAPAAPSRTATPLRSARSPSARRSGWPRRARRRGRRRGPRGAALRRSRPCTAALPRPAPAGAGERRDVLEGGDVAAQEHRGHRERPALLVAAEGEVGAGAGAEVVVAVELGGLVGRQAVLDAEPALEPAHRRAFDRLRRRGNLRRDAADHQPELLDLPPLAGERPGHLSRARRSGRSTRSGGGAQGATPRAAPPSRASARASATSPSGSTCTRLASQTDVKVRIRADEAVAGALEPCRRGLLDQALELPRGENLVARRAHGLRSSAELADALAARAPCELAPAARTSRRRPRADDSDRARTA